MANHIYDQLLAKHAGNDSPFLVFGDGSALSYRAFLERASRFANCFGLSELSSGDRLAVQVSKSADALALYVACVQSGVIFLPLNTAYTAAEVTYFVRDSGAKLLIGDDSKSHELSMVAQDCGASFETVNGDGTGSFLDKASACSGTYRPVDRSADDLAAFLYTSGTTGRSKGAMLSHDNLVSNALTLKDHWKFSADDVLLHALPIFHTHGLFVATNVTLAAGSSMIFQPAFKVDDVLDALPLASTMMGVPTFYTRLLDDDRLTQQSAKHMRLFISGSAPLLADTHVEFEARTGHRILERYGMTETNMISSNPYDGARRPGTVGFALPGIEVEVRDPATGVEVQKGEVGSIELRGPNVFKGYWNMPEKTAEDMRSDGFFITGDLGRIDEQGYLQIVGRSKDLIISGGYNIYPKEVEGLLDDLPGIKESAVIGVPHPDFGEGVVAAIVPQRGVDIELDAVRGAVSTQIAKFKQPKVYELLDELPRNTMGKVQKNLLREKFANSFKS